MRKVLGAQTNGREYCRTLWPRIMEAFGGKADYGVVLASCNPSPEAIEGLNIPSNFIVRRRCPQVSSRSKV